MTQPHRFDPTRRLFRFALAAPALAMATAHAADLSVTGFEVTQGFQNGGTTLVGGRATMVRVKVGVSGSGGGIAGVDAVLRMIVDGVESSAGPFYSVNGPILAPLAPSSGNINDTLNFIVVPPVSGNVVFKALVNPTASVVESSYANNLGTSPVQSFVCRKIVDLAYVAIDYTPGGGLPPLDKMEPGNGDAFLRGIYAVGEWNYHRSPLGSLTWSTNVNSSGSQLLSALMDIRNVQIPGAGYAPPEFVYGYLPGNPYSGNGLANATPGIVAFGNTSENRWQRTFAHEIGHLWGLPHNGNTLQVPSIDVEHHLKDPLDLAVLHPSSQNDVMVAGLLTPQAWVAQGTYNDCLADARSQCGENDAPGGGGAGGEDAAALRIPCLRVAGVLTFAGRTATLDPIFRFPAAEPTIDDPSGDVAIEALDAAGRIVHRVRLRTDSMRESCAGGAGLNPDAVLYALVPEMPGGAQIDRVVVRDLAAGRGGGAPQPVLASLVRSAQAPVAAIDSAWPAIAAPAPAGGAWKSAPVEVKWSASDPDGDPLSFMLLYSPDGGSRWVPVIVNGSGDSTIFDSANLPGAEPGQGMLKLLASDGFNTTDADGTIESIFMGGNPPDVHILSPNSDAYARGASVVMHASGWDMEDQYLPDDAFTWSSNVDGPLGVGRLFTVRTLSQGVHEITLVGVDSDGLETTKTIEIVITSRSIPTADVNGDGHVDGADLTIVLGNWAHFGTGDLNFDGTVDGADITVLLGAWAP